MTVLIKLHFNAGQGNKENSRLSRHYRENSFNPTMHHNNECTTIVILMAREYP